MQKSLWLLLFSFSFACSGDPISPDLGLDYYPIVVGDYRIYDVTETTYVDRIETIDVYQQRESFNDSIVNGDETTYLLKIERRADESASWVSIETNGIRQTNQFLEYQEDNLSFIRMTYPVKFCKENDLSQLSALSGGECSEWDGNSQNQNTAEFYHYRKLEENDFTLGNGDHIKLVLSDFPANLVKRDQRYEIYARGIGLVERSYDQVDFCFDQTCNGVDIIQDGTILVQTLIEYGSE